MKSKPDTEEPLEKKNSNTLLKGYKGKSPVPKETKEWNYTYNTKSATVYYSTVVRCKMLYAAK